MTNSYIVLQGLISCIFILLFRQQIAKGILNLQNHVVGGSTNLATGLQKVYIYISYYLQYI